MRQSILEHLGNAIRGRDDDITHEPLPRRWVDLVHHLDKPGAKAGRTPRTQSRQGAVARMTEPLDRAPG